MKLYTEVGLTFLDGKVVLISKSTMEVGDIEIPQAKGRSKQAPTQTVSSSTAPWAGQQPYLTHGFEGAKNLYEQNKGGIPFFPGQTYAPQSQQSQEGLAQMEARARAGSPVHRAGNEQMLKTIQGDYLNNPYLSNAIRAEFNQQLPGLQSNASKSGNYFSSAAQLAQGKALGDVIDRRMADQYSQERDRQQQAIGNAPAYAQQDYNDANQLRNVGQQHEDEAQQAINEQMARHEQKYASPQEQLARYVNMINGNFGSQGSQMTTGFAEGRPNRLAGGLSGALGGAQIGGGIGGPMGAGVGAGIGGLLGLFR